MAEFESTGDAKYRQNSITERVAPEYICDGPHFFSTFDRGILMDPLAIKAAEATLETAFKNRNEIITALKNALKRVAQGKLTVVIFGIGGTGKTTAQLLLTEGIDKSNKNLAYVPTVRANKKSAKDNMFVTIWDTPGQDDFRELAWDAALASIQKSHRAVLINVVSYGHNSAALRPSRNSGSVPLSTPRTRSSGTIFA